MYTYIIESQGLYKIGKSEDVKKRIRSFKTGNPSLQLIRQIKGNYEPSLHKHFRDKWSHLEWYNLTQEDIENIDNVIKLYEPENEVEIEYQAEEEENSEEYVTTYIPLRELDELQLTLTRNEEGAVVMYSTMGIYTLQITEYELEELKEMFDRCIRGTLKITK